MAKFVHNTYIAGVTCNLSDDRKVVFHIKEVDKMTGEQRHSGYTEVSDEDYEFLKANSGVFKSFTKQKMLTVVDECPQEALSVQQILQKTQGETAKYAQEVVELKARVAELTQANEEFFSANEQLKTLLDNAQQKLSKYDSFDDDEEIVEDAPVTRGKKK
jgi:vacuolar-type H+-ATPase subunit I/STV1